MQASNRDVGAYAMMRRMDTRPTDISDTLLRLERSALDRWGAGDPGGFLDIYARDVTYFDPSTERRLDDWQTLADYYAPWVGKIKVDRYQIEYPRVVSATDMAVLSYNLTNYVSAPDGSERVLNRWNSSTVYRREGDSWKVVHSHWSYVKPTITAGSVTADTGADA
jgi:ketosteroid isomerase-like protein